MERFAEVFGDCIETEDCITFLKEALKIIPSSQFKPMGECASADDLFDAIDTTVSDELARKSPVILFGDRNYFLIRSFYRFVHDAYLWDDLADLTRWEEELFDSLNGYNQKNYTPVNPSADELGRELVFLKYCNYIVAELGETVFKFVFDSVKDWRGEGC